MNQQYKESTTFAIAAVSNDDKDDEVPIVESISTAHERFMAHVRDKVLDKTLHQQQNDSATWDVIYPSEPILEILMSRKSDAEIDDIGTDQQERKTTVSSTTGPYRGGPKKATTAAAFFGQQKSHKTITSVADVPGSKSSSRQQSNDIKSIKSNQRLNTIRPQEGEDGKENTDQQRHHIVAKSKETNVSKKESNNFAMKKKSNVSTPSSSDIVGNADDFVGDLDDDDEDDEDEENSMEDPEKIMDNNDDVNNPNDVVMEEVTEDKKSSKSNKTSKRSLSKERTDDDDIMDSEEKLTEPTKGAMDAFVSNNGSKTSKEGNGLQRQHPRRRKKMVEKTYVDSRGYLHTETQEVWEEIPSDEENDTVMSQQHLSSKHQQESTSIPSKKQQVLPSNGGGASTSSTTRTNSKPNVKKGGAHASNLKQGNLMGFFAKK